MNAQIIGAYASAAIAIVGAIGTLIRQIRHEKDVSAHNISGSAKDGTA
jgi:hypothetical protein